MGNVSERSHLPPKRHITRSNCFKANDFSRVKGHRDFYREQWADQELLQIKREFKEKLR
jgi:hypothetical protein